ncbi:hypothetical protein BSL78_15547 [Apostichopus japonicus]|uniref:Uncharacterized protein n=1 Tax=Stichopus japonicus TaxID=307972 RepID=A0A2G8KHW9_STIJA|nr:hypothetical protein BSL78_15547 [Apostichopus japonicus]
MQFRIKSYIRLNRFIFFLVLVLSVHSYLVENPDDAHKVELLKELINRQLFVLDEALTYHGTVIQSSLTELQDLLEKKLKHQFQAAGLTSKINQSSQTPEKSREVAQACDTPSKVFF